jgi:hypothetical protein
MKYKDIRQRNFFYFFLLICPFERTVWRGDDSITIDRFDARSHLDFIQEYDGTKQKEPEPDDSDESCMCNYERYRTIIQNDGLESILNPFELKYFSVCI